MSRAVFVPASAMVEGSNNVLVFETDGAVLTGGDRQVISTQEQLWLNEQGVCVTSPDLAM